jgi:hypothetical protein
MLRFLSALFVLCGVAAVAEAASAATPKPYRSSQGYTLTPRAGWTVSTQGQPAIDLFFLAPVEKEFQANLNVVITKAASSDTLEDIRKQSEAAYESWFDEYQPLDHATVRIAGTDALQLTCSYRKPNDKARTWLRQYVILRRGKAYVFSCTALADSSARYAPLFSGIMGTLHWR